MIKINKIVLKSLKEAEVFHLSDKILEKITVTDKGYKCGGLALHFYKDKVVVFNGVRGF